MVGGIKASSPGMKSMSADMFLDLHTMSAPSGEERKLGASAQVERAGWCCRRSDSSMHTCCGRATVMVLVSPSSGLSVGGCPERSRYFGPHPVGPHPVGLVRNLGLADREALMKHHCRSPVVCHLD